MATTGTTALAAQVKPLRPAQKRRKKQPTSGRKK